MSKSLGCLLFSGLLITALTLAVIAAFLLLQGGAMFSPGELNAQTASAPLGDVRAHAELEHECQACHTAPWEVETMSDGCLTCHTQIAAELENKHSLHGYLNVDQTTCYACHPEHNGPTANLTNMDSVDFPHELTGFSLQGHAQLEDGRRFVCEDCHQDDLTKFELAACEECHLSLEAEFTQTHTATFGTACLACHDGLDTYGAAFDHSQTSFPLEDAHATSACADCHAGATTLAQLQAAPQDCYACHASDDAHSGQFGPQCEVCHTPTDWEQAAFDHNATGFPLEGEHSDVDCEDCHQNNRYTDTPQDCYACHAADDAHNGEYGDDCAACHTPVDWEQATFDHAQTAFPLTGSHTAVACEDCHQAGVYGGTPQACNACHAEPVFHLGLFSSTCEDCHTTTAWSPAEYNQAHTFPFNHGESGISDCVVCHDTSLNQYTCYGCHEHTPANIAAEHREEGISNYDNCVECHPTGREEEGEHGDDD